MYLYDMPYKERRELCQILDLLDNAWRTLAGSVGLSALEVSLLEKEIHKPSGSPSDVLLDKLGLKNFTVDELACKLKESKLMRALDILKPLISKNLYESLTEMATKEIGANGLFSQLPNPSTFKRMNYEQMKTKTIDQAFLEQLKKDSKNNIDKQTKNEKTTNKKDFNTEMFEAVKLKNTNNIQNETSISPVTDSEITRINKHSCNSLEKDLEMMNMMQVSLFEKFDEDKSNKNESSDVTMNSGSTNETSVKTSEDHLKNMSQSTEDQTQNNLMGVEAQKSNMGKDVKIHDTMVQNETKEKLLSPKKQGDASSLLSTSTTHTSLLDNLTMKQLEALLSDSDASDYSDLYNIMKKEDASRFAKLEKLRKDLEESEED